MPALPGVDLQLGVPLTGDRRAFLRRVGAAGLAAATPDAFAVAGASRAAALRKLVRGTVLGQGERGWTGGVEGMVWQQRKPSRRP